MKSDCPQGGVCAVATPLVGWLALALACAVLAGMISCKKPPRRGATSSLPAATENAPLPPRTITLPPQRGNFFYIVSVRDENTTDVNSGGWRDYGPSSRPGIVNQGRQYRGGALLAISTTGTEVMLTPLEFRVPFFQLILWKVGLRKAPLDESKCPASLSFLTSLLPNDIQGLVLSESEIRGGDLANLRRLTSLRWLNLSSTDITQPRKIKNQWLAEVGKLKQLRSLDLWRTNVTDAGLAHLKGLTSLRMLLLSHTPVTDAGLAHLKALTSLQRLDLNDTQITDAGLVYLKGMTSLRWLRLDASGITNAGLVHVKALTSLEMLDLSFCDNITDAGLVHLRGMNGLQWLAFRGTPVTEAALAELKRALPKCSIWK